MYQETKYGTIDIQVDTTNRTIDLDLGEGCSVVEMSPQQAAHLAAKLSYFAVTGKLPE